MSELALPNRVSRGFNRLGIFIACLTLFASVLISFSTRDPVGWWVGGLIAALCAYGLTRLLGWAINGFSPSVAAVAPVVPAETTATVSSLSSEPATPPSISASLPAGQERASEPFRDLNGIAGWLVLPAIGTCVRPLFLIKDSYELAVLTPQLAAVEADFSVQLFIWSTWLILTACVIGWFYAAVLLFKHKTTYPKWFIWLVAADLFVGTIALIIAAAAFDSQPTPRELVDLARAFISAVIWIPYMLVSKRVASTFVER